MSDVEHSAEDVIERLYASYNVSSQKDLAEAMNIHPGSVSNWIQRNSVPSNAILSCVIDTGADPSWLLTGELKKSSFSNGAKLIPGDNMSVHDIVLSSGGKPILRRMLDAYGFEMQKELGDRFNLSSGTISSWVRRGYFPGDIVATCALETGVSLLWLVTGQGAPTQQSTACTVEHPLAPSYREIPRLQLVGGELKNIGTWLCDITMIPKSISSPAIVDGVKHSWLIDMGSTNISNGLWFISIDGSIDICDVSRMPGNKLRISSRSSDSQFSCDSTDISPVGQVFISFDKLI
ncbi:helix-turn-helix domain-containing protein [Edwardsiella tarda]|uniref:helix-turn-helix domain-containing protein n=1 Tax=Edwardsiella tarda TaxID=636 RepID=UPI00098F75C0|nr:helix-turn-helix domain-containing protein [Edwardsiella tarda]